MAWRPGGFQRVAAAVRPASDTHLMFSLASSLVLVTAETRRNQPGRAERSSPDTAALW
jgi:hypothetical protein